MSITDELRNYTEEQIKWLDMTKVHYHKLFAIADRIDREHEQAVGFCKRLEDAAEKREDVELFGVEYMPVPVDAEDADGVLIRIGAMPVDANDVPIRIGDVMEWPDGSTAEVVGIGPDTFFYVEDGEDAAEWSCASDKIHHHEPTVEDLLWEFGRGWHEQMNGPETFDTVDYVERYAAKLRLKED